MSLRPAIVDDEESVEYRVRLDLKTVAWLMSLCEQHQAPPSAILAAVVRDVREDDEFEHDDEARIQPNAPSTVTRN